MKKITEAKANSLMRKADDLYDAGVIDQYAYELAMQTIREMENKD